MTKQQQNIISQFSTYLFWDIDIAQMDLEKYPSQIIQRVLEYGQWEDWKLIKSYYGLPKIVECCQKLRTLDPKALSYICCISDTPKESYRCYQERCHNEHIKKIQGIDEPNLF